MGVASGCGEQEVGVASGSGWNLWVWLLGCVFKEIYRFPHTTYPYSSCICHFLQQHPYFFFHFVKMILRSLRRRMPNSDFNFARRVRKIALYSDLIHSFDWKSAVEHDGGV